MNDPTPAESLAPEAHPASRYRPLSPCHPDGLFRVSGQAERRLFPWQQAQPGAGKPEKVGWTLEHDGHWEVAILCTTCRRTFWSFTLAAREDCSDYLRVQGRTVPLGLDPTPPPEPDSPDAEAYRLAREAARRAMAEEPQR